MCELTPTVCDPMVACVLQCATAGAFAVSVTIRASEIGHLPLILLANSLPPTEACYKQNIFTLVSLHKEFYCAFTLHKLGFCSVHRNLLLIYVSQLRTLALALATHNPQRTCIMISYKRFFARSH